MTAPLNRRQTVAKPRNAGRLRRDATAVVDETVPGRDELMPEAGGNRSGGKREQEIPYQEEELARSPRPENRPATVHADRCPARAS